MVPGLSGSSMVWYLLLLMLSGPSGTGDGYDYSWGDGGWACRGACVIVSECFHFNKLLMI